MRRIVDRAGTAIALAIALAWIVPTLVQTPGPKGCTLQERSNRALNEDAQKNAGVICPPDVDPSMKAPTPHGSPGSAPTIQPK
jgi:hypothetical protein